MQNIYSKLLTTGWITFIVSYCAQLVIVIKLL